MSTKQQAANDLRNLGNRMKGIIALADDLEIMGSMEQAEQEIKNRIALAETQEGNAALRLKEVQARVTEAEGIVNSTRAAAAQIEDRAKREADGIRAKAIEEARAIEGESKKRLAELEVMYKERTSHLAGVKLDITAQSGTLQQLNDKIQKVKEEARKALS